MLQVEDPSDLENLKVFNEEEKPHKSLPPRRFRSRMPTNRLLWQGKWGPAFWTVTGALSLTVNIILLIVLVLLARELFALKALLSDQLIGGLYANFVKMDASVIETTITVSDSILVEDSIIVDDTLDVVFDLPLQQETTVMLAEDTPIGGATVNINTPFFSVNNALTHIVLPAGTELPTSLDLIVPVSQTVPIRLTVPVNLEVPFTLEVPVSIPLNQTDLHEPFQGLQGVLGPYQTLLAEAPDSWGEAVCRAGPVLCWLLGGES